MTTDKTKIMAGDGASPPAEVFLPKFRVILRDHSIITGDVMVERHHSVVIDNPHVWTWHTGGKEGFESMNLRTIAIPWSSVKRVEWMVLKKSENR